MKPGVKQQLRCPAREAISVLAMELRSIGAPSADTDNTLGQSSSGIITSIISTDISSLAETCQKPELATSHREGSKTNFSPWEMTGGELQGGKKKKEMEERHSPQNNYRFPLSKPLPWISTWEGKIWVYV